MASKWACGVPGDKCMGGNVALSNWISRGAKAGKAHTSAPEAFRCHARWLLSRGFEQVGSREFRSPGGAILVLTKKCRFGGRLRRGKEGRFEPHTGRKKGALGGLVIG